MSGSDDIKPGVRLPLGIGYAGIISYLVACSARWPFWFRMRGVLENVEISR
jgi:hypothetical protein